MDKAPAPLAPSPGSALTSSGTLERSCSLGWLSLVTDWQWDHTLRFVVGTAGTKLHTGRVLPIPGVTTRSPRARLPALFRTDSEGTNGTSVMKTYWIVPRITNTNQMDNASGRGTCLMIINIGHTACLGTRLITSGKIRQEVFPRRSFRCK